jgi:hypothetical protein
MNYTHKENNTNTNVDNTNTKTNTNKTEKYHLSNISPFSDSQLLSLFLFISLCVLTRADDGLLLHLLVEGLAPARQQPLRVDVALDDGEAAPLLRQSQIRPRQRELPTNQYKNSKKRHNKETQTPPE